MAMIRIGTSLAEFWYKLVKSGAKTLDQVPEKWREEVRQKLEADNE